MYLCSINILNRFIDRGVGGGVKKILDSSKKILKDNDNEIKGTRLKMLGMKIIYIVPVSSDKFGEKFP